MQSFKTVNVVKTALKIRTDIKDLEIPETWPPNIPEVNIGEKAIIPESLLDLLETVLTGKPNSSNTRQRVQRLVSSFGQDIVYAVTNGQLKPTKHILLPFAVKSLTGNVELIKILNRLGHSVSYSKLEEIETALCLQKLSVAGDMSLPANIYAGVPTTLAFDNIDRLEEILSGKGSSHRVNGIAIQPKMICPQLQRLYAAVSKTKKRGITPNMSSLPSYNVGQREDQQPLTV